MRILTPGRAVLIGLLLAVPAGAQEKSSLSPEGKAAAEQMMRAAWNGASSTNGFSFKMRAVPLFSEGIIDAVTHAAELSKEEQAALHHLGEVVIPADGWFMDTRLAPGTYRLGLAKAPRYLHWELRDDTGAVRRREALWLEGRATQTPSSSVSMADGVMIAQLRVGDGITFDWRFVTVESHDAAAAAGKPVTEGVVTLISDLEHAATLQALAKELAASVPVHAKLLGVPVPKEPLYLYLYRDRERYQRMDRMLSGGKFADHGAVTAALTERSYIWYVPWSTPIAFDDHGATLSMRALCIHEWIGEGLAELGVVRALEASDAAAGAAYAEQAVELWRAAGRSGERPALEDFLVDDQRCGIKIWYSGALVMAREMERRKPGGIAALLPFFEGEPVYRNLRRRVVGEVERQWGVLPELWRSCTATIDGAGDAEGTQAVVWGSAERIGEGEGVWRCVADAGGQSRVLGAATVTGPDLLLEGEFAFHQVGQKQVDFYFG
ncbi:MAG: hypothetical protein ACYTGX_09810 [Planctomycetota bacterium]|jgi:hypothetical protein